MVLPDPSLPPSAMSQHDTAGIIADVLPDADWKKTLEIANRRFAENQAELASAREESESGRTVPEWKRLDIRAGD